MSSFDDAMLKIKSVLETDAALSSFCASTWGKEITVKRVFRRRTEIGLEQLPVILMTHPEVVKSYRVGARDGVHTIRLYCGFREEDREKAQAHFIRLEELIDDALLAPEPDTLGVFYVDPSDSVNDEGALHPVYFMLMDMKVQHRR